MTTEDHTEHIRSLETIIQRKRFLFAVLMIIISASITRCSWIQKATTSKEKVVFIEAWSPESYARFVEENMALLNRTYSHNYAPAEFIVDRENGSALIQDLIDPRAVAHLLDDIQIGGRASSKTIQHLEAYIKNEFQFDAEDEDWQSAAETVTAGKGDCKNLSLLLLSLLLAADIHAYAAVSNGHMWVVALDEAGWQSLETDDNPERMRIYSIPGFYDAPLYRIYPDRTEKRTPIRK